VHKSDFNYACIPDEFLQADLSILIYTRNISISRCNK